MYQHIKNFNFFLSHHIQRVFKDKKLIFTYNIIKFKNDNNNNKKTKR